MSAYGSKLDPYRKLREPLGVKGIRQSVVVTNNPSTIDQNQQLLVRFPNLSTNDVIVPRTARLAFTIELTSKDANATVYQNLGRAIVKKTTIKISGNEVMSIDDSDIFHCYVDLWRSPSERLNMAYQGIGKSNMLKHRVGAGNASTDAEDQAIAGAFKNRFCIPLDFELLETHMPFYQAGLGDRLEYELTFNDYIKVISSLLLFFMIDSLGAQRCISSMTALPPKSSPRKKTCSGSLHSRVGMQSKVSGSFRRDIFRS